MNSGIILLIAIVVATGGALVWDNARLDKYQAQCVQDGGRLIRLARSDRFICAKVEVLYTDYVERNP